MLFGDDNDKHAVAMLLDGREGRTVAGQLDLTRDDFGNVVRVFAEGHLYVQEHGCLKGISEAGKVSLLDCVEGRLPAQTFGNEYTLSHGNMVFRYALFGSRHISSEEACLRRIQFTIEGAGSSVLALQRSKRPIFEPHQEIIDAINRKKPDYLEGDDLRNIRSMVVFTEDGELLPRTRTVLGNIGAFRVRLASYGLDASDSYAISIEFDDEPTTMEGAWAKMRDVRQFFTWMMGYAPAWKDVTVFASTDGEDVGLRVFGPNEWKDVPEQVNVYGSLIDASSHSDHFMKVMRNWLERNADARRRSANARFFGCFRGTHDRFVEDGIVSAANMFDLLPDEDKPQPTPLPEGVLSMLKDTIKNIGTAMSKHPERDEVLTALGYVKANKSLGDVVKHRARTVTDHFGQDKLKNLDDDIRLAVRCRNHYTHGPRSRDTGGVDFSDFEVVHFLTRTLEFIYGASELLLCGWDTNTSTADVWHPLGGFVKSYDRSRAILMPNVD